MRIGAGDYLTKPFALEELDRSTEPVRAVDVLRPGKVSDCASGCALRPTGGLVGKSPENGERSTNPSRWRIPPTPVLILARAATGKEIVARGPRQRAECGQAVHPRWTAARWCDAESKRALRPCEGAFTGANRSRGGLLSAADGGRLSGRVAASAGLAGQAAARLAGEGGAPGGSHPRGADHGAGAAATNRDLSAMVAQGTFRKDLYFR